MKAILALLALCVLPLPAQLGVAAPAAPAAPPASAARAPAQPASEVTECAVLRKRYRDSANCYAPFLNANGTRKPGALEACGEPVPYPARECSSEPLR